MAGPDESLNLLLDDLEAKALQHNGERSEEYWVCQRRYPRSPFRANCNIYFFTQGSSSVALLTGRTRNLSRMGVAVLVRRVFRSGEPVEVEITLPDRPNMYMAGVVTFCRYAGRSYHEVGVDLRAASASPIFHKNPLAAMELLEWLRPQTVIV